MPLSSASNTTTRPRRLAALLAGALAFATPSARAEIVDTEAPPTDELNAPDASAPERPYVVLGHRALDQSLVRNDHAWTVGDEGALIAWTRRADVWRPTAVAQTADATRLSVHGEQIFAYGETRVEILDAQRLEPVKAYPADGFARCSERLSWQLTEDHQVCARHGDSPPICAHETLPLDSLAPAVCVEGAGMQCLSVATEEGAKSWCLDAEQRLRHSSHPEPSALFFPEATAGSWVVRVQDGWANADRSASVTIRNFARRPRGGPACFHANPDLVTRCQASAPVDGPVTDALRATLIQDLYWTGSALFLLFRDGWLVQQVPSAARNLNVPTSDEAPLVPFIDAPWIQARRTLEDGLERVWLRGTLIGAGGANGDARLAICDEADGRWAVSDLLLASGEATPVSDGDGACPARADYHGDTLLLSFGARTEAWSLTTDEIHRPDEVYAPFGGTIDGALVAQAQPARYCPMMAWRVSVRSTLLGEFPLHRELCAHAVTSTRWQSEGARSSGPALIFASAEGSAVFMIDEDTLESFVVQARGALPAQTRVHRRADGSWVLVDPYSLHARHFSPAGEPKGESRAVVLGAQLWEAIGDGVLRNAQGQTLLITDGGAVFKDVGTGPLVARTLTGARARVAHDPGRFVRALLDALTPKLRASR